MCNDAPYIFSPLAFVSTNVRKLGAISVGDRWTPSGNTNCKPGAATHTESRARSQFPLAKNNAATHLTHVLREARIAVAVFVRVRVQHLGREDQLARTFVREIWSATATRTTANQHHQSCATCQAR